MTISSRPGRTTARSLSGRSPRTSPSMSTPRICPTSAPSRSWPATRGTSPPPFPLPFPLLPPIYAANAPQKGRTGQLQPRRREHPRLRLGRLHHQALGRRGRPVAPGPPPQRHRAEPLVERERHAPCHHVARQEAEGVGRAPGEARQRAPGPRRRKEQQGRVDGRAQPRRDDGLLAHEREADWALGAREPGADWRVHDA